MSHSRKLPPSERDFDIYEAVHIAGYPTRDEAQKHGISPTRVRQIVRRVVEWLGEVIPPQAKIAKEQQSHLARQIAADRFNLQYAEASTNWYQSGDIKFASLRIRLTHAQARLGVPGSLIGGLAADAIEGLEVPAYQPPQDDPQEGEAWDGDAPAEPPLLPEYFDINSDIYRQPLNRRNLKNLPPELYDPIPLADITSEIVAARAYYGFPLKAAIVRQLQDEGQLPTADDIRQSRFPSPTDGLPASTPQSASTPHSALPTPHSNPPPRDFSVMTCVESAPADETHHAPAETLSPASTCNDNTANQNAPQHSANTPSQPLLTTDCNFPVTELHLTAHHAGATLSQTSAAASPLVPLSPCPLVRPGTQNPESAAKTD